MKCIFTLVFQVLFFSTVLVGQTYTVNSLLDTPDANVGDGICDDGNGNCTFRAAVEEANSSGAILINFSNTGTVTLTDELISSADGVILDGTGVTINFAPVSWLQINGPNTIVENFNIIGANFGASGAVWLHCIDCVFRNNTLTGTDNALQLGVPSDGVIVEFNNIINSTGGGISIYGNNSIIRNNVITNSGLFDGVFVASTSSDNILISQNEINCSGDLGIDLVSFANNNQPTPQIDQATSTTIQISNCSAGDVVEVFSNPNNCTDCEGENYLGNATDNGDGTFTYNGSFSSGDLITCTSTTGMNTSEFSTCATVVDPCAGINATTIEVTNTNDSGPGSLRNAIECANADGTLDNIIFSTSGTISIITNLPNIVDNGISIDGGNDIVIDAGGLPNGISISGADDVSILNLDIINTSTYGIISTIGPHYNLTVDNCTIISETDGILLGFGIGATISNNTITATGSEAIRITAQSNINVTNNSISNSRTGIYILFNSNGLISGNTITNSIGLGIISASGSNNFDIINNIIENNGNEGVSVNGGSVMTISQNSINCNGNDGIRLQGSANNSQPTPQIDQAISSSIDISNCSPGDVVEVFLNPNNCTDCEGEVYLGDATDNGDGTFTFAGTFSVGDKITVTSTTGSNTSEFSACATIIDPCTGINATTIEVINTNDSGPGSLRNAIECVNADPILDNIQFNFSTGSAPFTIQPLTSLPNITDDGVSITAGPNYGLGEVILDGSAGTTSYGLSTTASSTTIEDLVINNFPSGILFNGSNGTLSNNVFTNCPVYGIIIGSGPSNVVSGNYIGTDVALSGGMGNSSGIFITGSTNSILNNTIAYNTQTGVLLNVGAQELLISQNTMYCNNASGITMNPPANNSITAPILLTATPTEITGSSIANATIEVFIDDDTGCPVATCQGKTYLGSTTADASGNWSFSGSFAVGDEITATATGTSNNTSEFSGCETVIDPCTGINATTIEVTNTNDSGPGSLRQAIECVNADATLDNIQFNFSSGSIPFRISPLTSFNWIIDDGVTIDGTINGYSLGDIIIDGVNVSGTSPVRGRGNNFTIRGLRFENGTGGIRTDGDNSLIEDNVFMNQTSNGVYFFTSSNGTIQNNTIVGAGSNGVQLSLNSDNNTISGNTFTDNDDGITVGGSGVSNQNLITQNSFSCNGVGINIFSNQNNNNGQPSPIIVTAQSNQIQGTASAADNIEIFSHNNATCPAASCQGEIFLGSTTADASGNWTLAGSFTLGDEVTATATDASNNTSEFSACATVSIPPPPLNDPCSGATTLTNGVTQSDDNSFATSDPTTGACTNADNTVWYTFTTSATESQVSITTDAVIEFIEIYTDCAMTSTIFSDCGSGQAASATNFFCLEPSTTYYVQVGSSAANAGAFDITYTEDATGVPEVCALATNLGTVTCGASVEPTSAGMAYCVEENSTCVTLGSEWSVFTIGAGVTGLLTNSGAGSTETDIYSGSDCNNLTLVAGQNASCVYPDGLLIPVTAGETYWIQQGTGGFIQLEGSCCTTVANDQCSGATILTSGVTLSDDNSCATSDPTTGGCTNNENTLWYTFTTSANESHVDIQTNNMEFIEVYDDCTMTNTIYSDCTSGTVLTAADLFCLEPNTTYYVQVGTSAATAGPFEITIAEEGFDSPEICTLAFDFGTVNCGEYIDINSDGSGYCVEENSSCVTGGSEWYQFSIGNGIMELIGRGSFEADIYSGADCNNLTLVAGQDMTCEYPMDFTFPVAEGETYWVQLGDGGFMAWEAICCSPPTNDMCSGATLLTSGVPVSGDNSCATTDNSQGMIDCSVSGDPMSNTVWYEFNNGSVSHFSVEVTGFSNYELKLFESSCTGIPLHETCSEIFIGSIVNTFGDAYCASFNTTFFLELSTTSADAGPFEITFTENPETETCEEAYANGTINCGETLELEAVAGLCNAGGQGGFDYDNMNCDPSAIGTGWGSFVVGANVASIEIVNDFSGAIYSSSGNCSNRTFIGPWDYNSCTYNNTPFPVIPGNTYYYEAYFDSPEIRAYCCNTATVDISGPDAFCSGSSITLDAGAGPGAGYLDYVWTGGSTNQTLSVSGPGSYSVTVTTATYCTATDQVTITENTPPAPTILATENPVCPPATTTNLDAGPSYVSYAWSDASTGRFLNNATATIAGTDYTVTVTDANGCTGENTFTLFLSDLGGTINCPVNMNIGDTETISGNPSGSAPFVESFNIISGMLNANLTDNGDGTATITGLLPGTVQVEYLVSDANCATQIQGEVCTIMIIDPCPVFLPTLGNDGPICEGDPVNVILNLTQGTAPYSGNLFDGVTMFPFSNISNGGLIPVNTMTGTTFELSDITDAAGCSETFTGVTTTITVNSLPVAVADVNSPLCVGETATFTGSGGVNYSWSGPNGFTSIDQNPVINAVTLADGGTYNLTVTDGNGCSNVTNTNLAVNPEAMVTIDPNPATFCAGSSVSLNAGNGYASYAWTGGATSQTLSVMTAGTYFVTVTDVNGCTAVDQATVTENSALTPSISATENPVCPSATTTDLDAGPNYVTYLWSDASTGQMLNDASASVAGTTYSVTVTDATGCTGETSITLTLSELGGTIICPSTVDIGTPGSGNGLPTGTAPFAESFQLIPGTGTADFTDNGDGTYSIDGLTPGTVQVRYLVSDADCSTPIEAEVCTITIVDPCPDFMPTLSNDGPVCEGEAANIIFNLTQGTAPYSGNLFDGVNTIPFNNINNGDAIPVIVNTTTTFELSDIADAAGCPENFTGITTTITVNPLPVAAAAVNTPLCVGEAAVFTGDGGVSYNWSGPNGFTSVDQNPVINAVTLADGGTYSLTVTDGNGCTGVSTTDLIINPEATVTITPNPATFCSGGNVTLNAGNGYAAYQWSTTETTSTINVSTAGNYSVTVTDANGCTAVDQATVSESTALTPVITATENPVCPSATTTDLDAGFGYVSYLWSDASTSQMLNDASASVAGITYSVTVTDATGCTGETSITLTLSELGGTIICPSTIDIGTPGSGNGLPTGTAPFAEFFELIPGTGTADFTDNGDGTYAIDGLTPGTVQVRYLVSDADCGTPIEAEVCTITIVDPCPDFMPTLSNDGPVCEGEAVNIILNLTEGTAPYSGNLFDGVNTIPFDNINNGDAIPITVNTTTTFELSDIADAAGCSDSFTGITTTITVNPLPVAAAAVNTPLCVGETAVFTGDGGVSYNWSGPNGFISVDQNPVINAVTLADGGTYSLTVTDGNGCTGVSTTDLIINPEATVTITPNPATFCSGGNVTLNAGNGYAAYQWSTTETTPTINVTTAGNYSVTVTDANGCTAVDQATVSESTALTPVITATENPVCPSATTTDLDAGPNYVSYLWSDASTSQMLNDASASVAGITYSVTVTDATGCTGETSITLTLSELGGTIICPSTIDIGTPGSGNGLPTGTAPFAESFELIPGTGTADFTDNGDGTYVITGLTPGTVQVRYLVSDADCGTQIEAEVCTITIVDPCPDFMPTLSNDGPVCEGEAANIILNLTQGTAPYSGNIFDGVNTIPFSNINDGDEIPVTINTTTTFELSDITDAAGCPESFMGITTTITVNPLPVATADVNTPLCVDETAVFIGNGGVNYNWSGPNGFISIDQNPVINAVTAADGGTYSLTVTDGNGCTNIITTDLVVSPEATVTITPNPATFCLGGNVTLNAGNGYAAYQWSTTETTPTINVTTAGNYSVTVTDVNGCTAVDQATVSESTALTPVITATENPVCPSATTTDLDAGPNYVTYLWSDASTGQMLNDAAASVAGTTYFVTVTDATGCTGETSITLTLSELGGSINCPSTIDIGTPEAGNGLPTGTAPFAESFELIPGTGTASITDNGDGTYTIDGLTPGTVQVRYLVSDADCGTQIEAEVCTITIVDPCPDFMPTLSNDGPVCEGEAVNIILNLTEGTAPYSGNLFDGVNTIPFNNINNGDEIPVTINTTTTFELSDITDAAGCPESFTGITTTITVNPLPLATAAVNTPLCVGETAVFIGNGGVSYNWSGPNGFISIDQNPVINAVTAADGGTYSLTVTDGNGCTGVSTTDLIINPEATVGITPNPATFCTGGNVTLNAGNGYAAYQWSTTETTPTINVTTAGNYSVTVTDTNGCTAVDQATVSESTALTPVITAAENPVCPSATTTDLDAGPNYVTYLWSDASTGQMLNDAAASVAGTTYSVTVTDATGCTGETSITLTLSELGGTIICPSTVDIGTPGAGNGLPTGTAPFAESFELIPGTGTADFTDNGDGTYVITGLTPGTVQVRYLVSDADCSTPIEAEVCTITIVDPCPDFMPTLSNDGPVCEGEAVNIIFNLTQGTAPYSGNIFDGVNTIPFSNINNGDEILVTINTTTTFELLDITDAAGCPESFTGITTTITVNPLPLATAEVNTPLCVGETAVFIGNGGVSYNWSGPNGFISIDQNPVINAVTAADGGTYSLTVTDGNGCTGVSTTDLIINPEATVGITPNPATFCTGGNVTLNAGNGYATYQWSTTETTSTINVTTAGNYSVTVTDVNGCTAVDQATVSESTALTPVITATENPVCPSATTTDLDAGPGYVSYLWSDASTGQTLNDAAASVAGTTYSVTVTDATGCTGETSITLTLSELGGTIICPSTVDIGTPGSGNGLPTGTAPFVESFQLIPGTGTADFADNGDGTYSITGLTPGTVQVRYLVSDADCGTQIEAEVCTITIVDPCPDFMPTLSNDGPVCEGETVNIIFNLTEGTAPYSGNLFDGVNTIPFNNINNGDEIPVTINTTTTFELLDVIDAAGCPESFTGITTTITVNPLPLATAAVNTPLCVGEAAVFIGNGGVSYSWSGPNGFTSVDQNPVINAVTLADGGTYSLTVTDGNGCTNIVSADLLVEATTVVNITPNPAAFCTGSDVTLDAGADFINYLWSGGESTSTITVSSAGNYSVTTTDGNGCTAVDEIFVSEVNTSDVNISIVNTNFCVGDSPTIISATPAGGNWSMNALSGEINPANLGIGNHIITYTIEDGSGCDGEDQVSIEVFASPIVSIDPVGVLCQSDDSFDLNANPAGGNWSTNAPGGIFTPENVGTNLVEYSFTDENGCTTTTDMEIEVISPPNATASSNTPICENDNINLFSNGGVSYLWNGPAGFTSSQQNPTVSSATADNAGIYTVTVTDGNSCTMVISITVVAEEAPVAFSTTTEGCEESGGFADFDLTILENTVNGNTGNIVSWFSDADATNQIFSPYNSNSTSIYAVVDNGVCVSDPVAINLSVVANPSAIISNTTTQLDCDVSSIILDASASSGVGDLTYQWTDGEITPTINVNTEGIYSVTVTDSTTGCIDFTSITIINNANNPEVEIATPDGIQIDCNFPVIELIANGSGVGNLSYMWDNGINGQNNIIEQPGFYEVTVTDNNNNCQTVETIEVTENRISPIADAAGQNGEVLTCEVDEITVTAALSSSDANQPLTFLWNNNIADTSFSTSSVGLYSVTVTDIVNGCTDEASIVITKDTFPPISNAGPDQALNCAMDFVVLDGDNSSTGTNIRYDWIYLNDTIGNEITVEANVAGTYTLVVTNTDNNCSATATTMVTNDITPPEVVATSSGMLTCSVNEVVLDGDGSATGNNITYDWQNSMGLSISNAISTTTMTPDVYTFIVFDNDTGCQESTTVEITEENNPPNADAGPDGSLSCTVESFVLDGSSSSTGDPGDFSYEWQNSAGTVVSSMITYPAMSSDTFTLVITNNVNGCTASDVAVVSQSNDVPVAMATSSGNIDCSGDPVILDGTGSDVGGSITYSWQNSAGMEISNSLMHTVNDGDSYTLVVTNTDNDCESSITIIVSQDTDLPVADAGPDRIITCGNAEVILDGSNSSSGSDVSYIWRNSAGTELDNNILQTVSIADTYTLIVTNTENGCTASSEVIVTSNTDLPEANAGPDGFIGCDMSFFNLDGNNSSTGGEFAYEWRNSSGAIVENEITYQATIGDTFTLVVTNTITGCTSSDQAIVAQNNDVPAAIATSSGDIDCTNESVILDGTGSETGANISYSWLNSAGIEISDSLTAIVLTGDTYFFIVENSSNSCQSTVEVTVIEDAALPVSDAGQNDMLTCSMQNITLNGSGSSFGGNIQYSWRDSNGSEIGTDITQPVFAPDTYTLIVTNTDNGCTASSEVVITSNTDLPVADAGADGSIGCAFNSFTLDGNNSSTGGEFAYEWRNSSGAIVGNEITYPAMSGDTFTLIVTNTVTGCTSSDGAVVTQSNDVPVATATSSGDIDCSGDSVILDGNGSESGSDITYSWQNSAGVEISDSLTAIALEEDVYTFIVTNTANDCQSSTTVTVNEIAVLPNVSAGQDSVLTCITPVIRLDGTGSSTGTNISYSWQNSGGMEISIELYPDIFVPDTYTLIVTNTDNGCTASSEVVITSNTDLPVADAGVDGSIGCAFNSFTLDGNNSSTGGEFAYEWRNSSGAIVGNEITYPAMSGDTFTLIVTNTVTGCTSSDGAVVTQSNDLPVAIATSSGDIDCSGDSVILDGNGSESGSDITYSWQNSAGVEISDSLTAIALEEDVYTFIVTNTANDCQSSTTVTVNEIAVLPNVSAGQDSVLTCIVPVIRLDGTGSSTGTNISYSWQNSDGMEISTELYPDIFSPDTYTLIVTNTDNGCTASSEVVITSNTELPVADAGPDGIIGCTSSTFLIDGNNSSTGAAFSYEWTNSAGTIVAIDTTLLEVNVADTYQLVVTDLINGCTATSQVIVTQDAGTPDAFANVSGVIDCANSTVDLNGNGSSEGGIFSYQWIFAGNEIGMELALNDIATPGIYQLIVTNTTNGCSSTAQVEVIVEDNTLIADAGLDQNLNCNQSTVSLGGPNTSGGSTIEYSWDGPGGITGTDAILTVSVAGTYIFTVRDLDSGCSATNTVTVTEDLTPPIAQINGGGILDCDITTIMLNANNSSVGDNISYEWFNSSGGLIGNLIDIDLSTADTYTLVVTNTDNGCTASVDEIVEADGDVPSATIAGAGVIDCNNSNVLLDGSASSSGANYNYSWYKDDVNSVVLGNANTFTAQEIGTYYLVITDTDNNCSATSQVVVSEDFSQPTIIANVENDGILDCNNSSLSMNNSGSTAINYVWYDDSETIISTGSTATVSTPGFYLLVGEGINGCLDSAFVSVTQDGSVTLANATVSGILTCTDLEVTLESTGSSTGTDFSYEWFDDQMNLLGNNAFFNADNSGTYTLIVTDNTNGCTASDMIVVDQNIQLPAADAGANQELTCDQNSVLLDGSNSSAGIDFSYEWLDNLGAQVGINPTLSATVAGIYTLVVTDNTNGCSATDNAEVFSSIQLPTPIIENNEIFTCINNTVTLDGSTSLPSDVSYEWTDDNGIVLGTNSSIDVTQAGDYILVITDNSNGCSATVSKTISEDIETPDIVISNPDDITCIETEIVLDGTGSTSGSEFDYLWMDDLGNSLGTDLVLSINQEGVYNLIITDTENGCTNSETVTVIEDIMPPIADAGSDNTIPCEVVPLGVSLDGSGSSSGTNFSYFWSTDSGSFTSDIDIQNPSIDGVGTYNLLVTNTDNGCTTADQVMITEAEGPQNVIFEIMEPSCYGEGDGGITLANIEGGEAPFEYAIGNGPFTNNNSFADLASGNYEFLIKDGNGCVLTTSVNLNDPQELELELPDQVLLVLTESVDLSPVLNIENAQIESIVWSPGEGLSCTDCLTPNVSPTETIVYTLTVTTLNGCEVSEDILVEVDTDVNIVWELLTPYVQDGKNDEWIIPGIDDYPGNQVTIFNRWGDVILDVSPYSNNNAWAGKNKNGKLVPQGTYYYVIKYDLGQGKIAKGRVAVVR